jgi:hypothetical protein
MPARHKMYLNMCWPNPFHKSDHTKYISICVDYSPLMPTSTGNASQHVFTSLCQRSQKIHLNMCWPSPSHASENTKFISTCVDHTYPKLARKQNVSQLVLTKPHPYQRGNNMYLKMCWPNASHASEDQKYISTCVDKIPPMPRRTENESQHLFTKPLSCLREHKTYLNLSLTNMHLNLCWQNPSYALEETKCISKFVDQTHHLPGRT